MSVIKWIHISDLHFGCKSTHTVNIFREKLPEYARAFINSEDNVVKYLFVTGDLRYAKEEDSAEKNYEDASTFIKNLASICSIENSHIFIVPGNHDVSNTDDERIKSIEKLEDYKAGNGIIGEDILSHLKPTNNFTEIYKKICGREFENNHWLFVGTDVNILCLDSSLISRGSKNDYKKLIFGTTLIDRVLEKINKDNPTIALAHHCWDWLSSDEKTQLEATLKDNGVILYLSGHIHEKWYQIIQTLIRPNLSIHEFVCPTHMDKGEYEQQTTDVGFLTGTLNTDTLKGTVNFHKWEVDASDFFISNSISFPNNENDIQNFDERQNKNEDILITNTQYEHLHAIVGRNEKVEEIYETLHHHTSNNNNNPIIVYGTVGIGKTEVCKSLYDKLKKHYYKLCMPFVDLTSAKTLNTFCIALAKSINLELNTNSSINDNFKVILNKIISLKNDSDFFILYLDNFESLYYGLNEDRDNKDALFKWFEEYKKSGIKILISCLEKLDSFKFDDFEVKPLGVEDRKKLFLQIYTTERIQQYMKELDDLLKELAGHPLAIVLTASQALYEPTLDNVMNKWREIRAISQNRRHDSLATALEISWNKLEKCCIEKVIWGLLSLASNEVTLDRLIKLTCDDSDITKLYNGLANLNRMNLIYYVDKTVHMLSPIKEQCFYYGDEGKTLKETSINIWSDYIIGCLDKNQNRDENYSQHHKEVILILPDIFKILHFTASNKKFDIKMDSIVNKLYDLFCFSLQSLYESEFLNELNFLCDYYKKGENKLIYANLLLSRGNTERNMGKINKAKFSYDEAEKVYRNIKCKSGIANVLVNRGNLQNRQGEMEETLNSYAEAESIYSDENNSLGLANVSFNHGQMNSNQGNNDEAVMDYNKAMLLYEQNNNSLGLGNVYLNLGNIHNKIEEYDLAMECYRQAEYFYNEEYSNLGIAHVLKNRGNLYSKKEEYDIAMECYKQAEKLYRNERDNIGLANLLMCKGDLLMIFKKTKLAGKSYNEAKKLYEKESSTL